MKTTGLIITQNKNKLDQLVENESVHQKAIEGVWSENSHLTLENTLTHAELKTARLNHFYNTQLKEQNININHSPFSPDTQSSSNSFASPSSSVSSFDVETAYLAQNPKNGLDPTFSMYDLLPELVTNNISKRNFLKKTKPSDEGREALLRSLEEKTLTVDYEGQDLKLNEELCKIFKEKPEFRTDLFSQTNLTNLSALQQVINTPKAGLSPWNTAAFSEKIKLLLDLFSTEFLDKIGCLVFFTQVPGFSSSFTSLQPLQSNGFKIFVGYFGFLLLSLIKSEAFWHTTSVNKIFSLFRNVISNLNVERSYQIKPKVDNAPENTSLLDKSKNNIISITDKNAKEGKAFYEEQLAQLRPKSSWIDWFNDYSQRASAYFNSFSPINQFFLGLGAALGTAGALYLTVMYGPSLFRSAKTLMVRVSSAAESTSNSNTPSTNNGPTPSNTGTPVEIVKADITTETEVGEDIKYIFVLVKRVIVKSFKKVLGIN